MQHRTTFTVAGAGRQDVINRNVLFFFLQSVGIVPLSTILDLPSFCLSPALCLAHVSRSQICVYELS